MGNFSIEDANNMQAMIGFIPYELRQDINLSRLSRGFVLSLILHVGFAFWPAGTPRVPVEIRLFSAQALQITLSNSHQTATAIPKPGIRTPEIASSLEQPTPIAEDATPALLPLTSTLEQVYVAPENVEEMATVAQIEELPLPSNEQTPDGTLYLKILISESGSADRIDIVTSTLPDDYVATLINSFYQAKFNPARIAGSPVRSWRIIEIRFGDTEPAAS